MEIPEDQLTICLNVLEKIAKQPMAVESDDRFKKLITKIHRKIRRAERKQQKKRDRHLQESTTLVQQQQSSPQSSTVLPDTVSSTSSQSNQTRQPIHCYICKQPYRQIHHFYHSLCPTCAELNYQKRQVRANLQGRTALVTGGRIKIGYQTGLRLLQDGARVIVTTRFPKDCARRYSLEADFDQWGDRLQIYGLDLRNLPALETFIDYLLRHEPALDILINNAAQTIKRPQSFYQPLINQEQVSLKNLPQTVQSLILQPHDLPLLAAQPDNPPLSTLVSEPLEVDIYGQPLDNSPVNSWILKLEEVTTIELLEVQLVNAIAPFLLNSKLKPLLLASPFQRRFIINVSAMEGQFNRTSKTANHPHTNMAKAALNMMTRTSAQDYAKGNIFMNSVDTGWVTNENPQPKADHMEAEYGFYPPLDVVDGMARIYDPIVQGLQSSEPPLFGYFLKDYIPYPW